MDELDSGDTTGRDDDYESGRQDAHVERLRPNPAEPPPKVLTLVGFLGNSERRGHKRLYFSAAMDHYAEIRDEDILHRGFIEAARSPFVGLESTRLTVKRSALIDYVRSFVAEAIDDFDIDIQVSPGVGSSSTHPLTANTINNCGSMGGFNCPGQTQPVTQCAAMTCATCQTCQTQCQTCHTCYVTQCAQATCQTCNQMTCQTCNTQCNQQTCWNTCQTCHTNCGGVDCALNNPTAPAHCVPTPGPTRVPCVTNNC
jgi:hypothetical protein